MTKTQQKRMLAQYWMRMRHRPHRKSLMKRWRLVSYPRARKCGPRFPANCPSKFTLTKIIPA